MSHEHQPDDERRGLGKVVYSIDPEPVQVARREADAESETVDEASEESFPASDPPGFTGTAADPVEPEAEK